MFGNGDLTNVIFMYLYLFDWIQGFGFVITNAAAVFHHGAYS